jgi:hypothetical protein
LDIDVDTLSVQEIKELLNLKKGESKQDLGALKN